MIGVLEDEVLDTGDLFAEPEEFYKPPAELQYTTFERAPDCEGKRELDICLGTPHSLWAHLIWNACVVMVDLFESSDYAMQGKSVIELGAGAAVPSLICALRGASKVVITDYPEEALLDNIRYNVRKNLGTECPPGVSIEPYLWGTDTTFLLRALDASHSPSPPPPPSPLPPRPPRALPGLLPPCPAGPRLPPPQHPDRPPHRAPHPPWCLSLRLR
eukprot:gnl/Trimastix_PCT/3574.p3 GENE.gnl/Trimastix_PCT/3574~~gnl/Trimastix_PCT/3574.p3  ORF type:complete len:216 (-),score=20.12 gnl/Trimastix_PCT/3574:1001-1648(-)